MSTSRRKTYFFIPPHLQKTVDNIGVDIQRDGRDLFRVSNHSERLSRKALQGYLSFLHQPIKATIAEALPKSSKAHHQNRVLVHQLLRFSTTGSVEIPPDKAEGLDKETAECHAKVEQAMRDEDAWGVHVEIGNDATVQSSIPDSAYSLKDGFSFAYKNEPHQGTVQRELDEVLRSLVERSTGRSFDPAASEILFSDSEFKDFCAGANALIEGGELAKLIEGVAFEESVQQHLQSIEARVMNLSGSASFKRAGAGATSKKPPKDRLNDLLKASSALTPMMDSKVMQDIWTRYHFTERKDSPFENIVNEYSIFMAVMDVYNQQSDVTPEQMEAISQEFYALLSLSSKFTEVLGAGGQNIKDRDRFKKSVSARQGKLRDLGRIFNDSSIVGVSVDDQFLPEDYQDVLSSLEKYTKQGGSFISHLGGAGKDATLDFTGDLVTFVKESPATFAGFVALATTLYMISGGSADDVAQAVDYSAYAFGDEGLVVVEADPTSLPEGSFAVQNYHWDLGPLGPYKHYMFDNAVVGPARKMLDGFRMGMQWIYGQAGLPIDIENGFSTTADKVIQPLADKLFDVNILQNASHAAFWMYMLSKGINHGFKGANKVFELLSPLTDITYQGGLALGERVGLKERASLSQRLLALTDSMGEHVVMPRYEGDFEPCGLKKNQNCVLLELAHAARQRVASERHIPEGIKPADLSLGIGGLKKQFQISAENLAPTLKALNQFDMVLEHMADRVGVDQPWYQSYLQERVQSSAEALRAFHKTGDLGALQLVLNDNLKDVIAAELRSTERSDIYAALSGDELSEKTEKSLRFYADGVFGGLKRKAYIQEQREKINGEQRASEYVGARVNILGSKLWGGMVRGARAIKTAAAPLAKKPVIIAASAIAGAAVALDMAGAGTAFTDLISAGTGALASGAATTATFLAYNFVEDVLGVHVGSGIGLIAVGAGLGYAYRKTLPLGLAHGFSRIRGSVVDRIDAIDVKMGKALSSEGKKGARKFLSNPPSSVPPSMPRQFEPIRAEKVPRAPQPACQKCPAYEAHI